METSPSAADLHRMIVEWAAAHPKIRRVWVFGSGTDVAVELQPVADSEETLPVWMANCEQWRRELQDRTGQAVRLEWRDPDVAPDPDAGP